MYPENSKFAGMYNDFDDDFQDDFLYISDRDYGIYNMELTDVASETECTGLLARGRGEPDELSEYREMFNFGVAEE